MAFNLLGLLPGAVSLLGGLFGKQENSNQSQSSSGTGTTQSAGTSSTAQQTKTDGTTAQTSTQNTGSKSTENGTVIGAVNEAVKGNTTGQVTRLDSATTDMLRQGVAQMMGTVQSNQDAIQKQIQGASGFDADSFVKGIVQGAEVDASANLESGVNATRAGIGAGSKSNSAAALLEARLQRDKAGTVAQVKSNAQLTAEQIKGNNATTVANLSQTGSSDFGTMLQALLQAGETQTTQQEQTSNQASNQSSSGTSNNDTTSTGTTNQTSSQNETTAQQQVQSQQGTQTQSQNANGSSGTNTLDWSNFFSKIGSAMGATF